MDVSSEMVYPLVPLFLSSSLGASKSIIGLIEGIAEASASVLKLFSGVLADRFGKHKLLMGLGYGISTASRPVLALATGWQVVLVSRFTDRVGKGIRTAPRDAIIAASTPSERLGLAFGFHRAMDTVGAGVGPAVALLILAIWVADRLGRRRVILAGFMLFAGAYAGFAVADSPWPIAGLFILYGMYMGLSDGVQRAYLATLVPQERKATGFGLYHMVVGIAILPA